MEITHLNLQFCVNIFLKLSDARHVAKIARRALINNGWDVFSSCQIRHIFGRIKWKPSNRCEAPSDKKVPQLVSQTSEMLNDSRVFRKLSSVETGDNLEAPILVRFCSDCHRLSVCH